MTYNEAVTQGGFIVGAALAGVIIRVYQLTDNQWIFLGCVVVSGIIGMAVADRVASKN
jgi:hypothetical protein